MTSTLNRSLIDDDLEAQLVERGWVVVPLLNQGEVAELRDWYLANSQHDRHIPDGAYNNTYAEFSVIHTSPAFREAAFDVVVRVLTPHLEPLLTSYSPLVANFVNKPAHTGIVPMHQNWSVVDEEQFRSLSIWVALVDCDGENGTLEFISGSHQTLRTPRGMWAYEAFTALEDEVIDSLEAVSIRAGEAIILDDAVVHYSRPNRTDEDRLAIQLIVVPSPADARFYRCLAADAEGMEVEMLAVAPRFFWNFWHGDGDTRYSSVVERLHLPPPSKSAESLASQLRRRPDDSTVSEP